MKKQFIAKLLVLVMLLSMVPATALAVNGGGDRDNEGSNSNYPYRPIPDTEVATPPSYTGMTIDKATTSADKIEIADGEVAIKVTVVDGAAKVKLSNGAVKKLAKAVVDGVITLTIDDEGASKLTVSLPAKALRNLAKATGADLTIQSSVATISLSNALISDVGTAGTVKIVVEDGEDGVTSSIAVNGKELKDVEGFEIG